MPKQKGVHKLEGTIGDVTYYKSRDGYIAKEKTVISKQRILHDPKFKNTRNAMAEFGRAGKGSRLVLDAFEEFRSQNADSRVTGRLTRLMVKIIREDAIHNAGLRVIDPAHTGLLEGFEFNIDTALGAVMSVPVSMSVDRGSGKVVTNLPAFDPQQRLHFPLAASHWRYLLAAAELDFAGGSYYRQSFVSAEFPIDTVTVPFSHLLAMNANSLQPIFVVLGIQYLRQDKNGSFALLGSNRALRIIRVDKP